MIRSTFMKEIVARYEEEQRAIDASQDSFVYVLHCVEEEDEA